MKKLEASTERGSDTYNDKLNVLLFLEEQVKDAKVWGKKKEVAEAEKKSRGRDKRELSRIEDLLKKLS